MKATGGPLYHFYRMEDVLAGRADPQGPGEMMDIMLKQGFVCSLAKAQRIKDEWEKEDRIIHKNMVAVYKWRDSLPPCHG